MEIILFILILGVLVFVHELGHFLTAKRIGAKVEEFGFGFPPKIFSVKRGGTEYSLNLFPLGGFVKIFGEDGESRESLDSFASKSLGGRALTLAAGSLMNWIFAFILLSVLAVAGMPQAIDKDTKGVISNHQTTIIAVGIDSPAKEIGLELGDAVLSIKIPSVDLAGNFIDINISSVEQFQKFVAENKGKEIILTIKRGKDILEKKITPRLNPPEGQGPVGIALADTGVVSYPFYLAPIKGLEAALNFTFAFIKAIFNLLTDLLFAGKVSADLAGPVGIAVLTSKFSQLGINYLIQFIALLSLNLAIINLFPFPALDGGRLLFLIIEKFKGSPISQKIEKTIHATGFALLILLILVITFRDIERLF